MKLVYSGSRIYQPENRQAVITAGAERSHPDIIIVNKIYASAGAEKLANQIAVGHIGNSKIPVAVIIIAIAGFARSNILDRIRFNFFGEKEKQKQEYYAD